MSRKEVEEVRRLQDALLDQVMGTTDEEIIAELEEDGLDPETEAAAMRDQVALAAGRARMAAARAKLSRRPRGLTLPNSDAQAANDDLDLARRLTKAARNGATQSEGDVSSTAQDIRDIMIFQRAHTEPEG